MADRLTGQISDRLRGADVWLLCCQSKWWTDRQAVRDGQEPAADKLYRLGQMTHSLMTARLNQPIVLLLSIDCIPTLTPAETDDFKLSATQILNSQHSSSLHFYELNRFQQFGSFHSTWAIIRHRWQVRYTFKKFGQKSVRYRRYLPYIDSTYVSCTNVL